MIYFSYNSVIIIYIHLWGYVQVLLSAVLFFNRLVLHLPQLISLYTSYLVRAGLDYQRLGEDWIPSAILEDHALIFQNLKYILSAHGLGLQNGANPKSLRWMVLSEPWLEISLIKMMIKIRQDLVSTMC